MDWNPGDYVTGRYNLPMGLSMLETMELVEMGEGTMVKLRFAKPSSAKLMGKIMNGTVQKKLKSIIVPDKENRITKMTALGKKLASETEPVAA